MGGAAADMLCASFCAMQMMQWKRSGGKEFVFFQSHPGFAFGNENVTKEFYDKIMCREMGDALHVVVERGQRWKCPTYREGACCSPPHKPLNPSSNPFKPPTRSRAVKGRQCAACGIGMQAALPYFRN